MTRSDLVSMRGADAMTAETDCIDVFIPAHPKDFAVLPFCISSIRRYLLPKAKRIVVIYSGTDKPGDPGRAATGVELMSESSVPDLFPRSQMPSISWGHEDRSGWYFQQMLKWAVRKCSQTPDYFVVDADTILCRPFEVRRNGKYVLRRSGQYHKDYFRTYERLLGYHPAQQQSFIVNYMIFGVSLVENIIHAIEDRRPGGRWHEIIFHAIDRQVQSSFSEFETYGYYLSRFYPECFQSENERNLVGRRDRLIPVWFDRFAARLKGYDSISYHSYCR